MWPWNLSLLIPYNINTVVLEFDHYFKAGSGGIGYLEGSADNGGTWITIDTFQSNEFNEHKFYNVSTQIGNAGSVINQTQAKIRFRWTGNHSWFWSVDNVKVYEPAGNDISVIRLLNPSSSGRKFTSSEFSSNESIKIKLRNNGTTNYTTNDSFPLAYKINGNKPVRDTMILSNPWNSLDTITYTFKPKANLSATSNFTVDVWSELPADQNNNNDSLLGSFFKHLPNEPLTLPFFESFENTGNNSYKTNTIGLQGAIKCDFMHSEPDGRLRTKTGNAFAKSGFHSITIDRDTAGTVQTNYLLFTLNLANYDTSIADLYLDFSYMDHGEENHSNDSVWIRGSDQDRWIGIYDLYANKTTAGKFKDVKKLNLSGILSSAGQAVSSSFQIRFGQEDNSATVSTTGNDGFSFDDIQVSAIYQKDITVTAIAGPLDGACGDTSHPVKIMLENRGQNSVSNVPVTVKFTDTANQSTTFTDTMTQMLDSAKTTTFTFSKKMNLSGSPSYNVTAFSHLSGDQNRNNDSIEKTITIQRKPGLPTTTYDSVCKSGQMTLSAIPADTTNKILWYASATSDSILTMGQSYTTPVLKNSKRYYAESRAWYNYMLSTGFNGKWSCNGIMFNLVPKKPLTLDRFGIDCDTTVQRYLYVSPPTVAGFSANNVCFGTPVRFRNSSSTIGGSYHWEFGDGKTSIKSTPQHKYSKPDTFMVSLTVTSSVGCVDKASGQVEVYPLPSAGFKEEEACRMESFTFTNTSSIKYGTLSYDWNFGNGDTSAKKSPAYAYPDTGTYQVELFVESGKGCVSKFSRSLRVYPSPGASFSAPLVCAEDTLAFNNRSSIDRGSLNYQWNFGDGTGNTAKDPVHTYSTGGSFKVELVATSGMGCTDTYSVTIDVYHKPRADFSAKNACLGNAVEFSDSSRIGSGTFTHTWKFGDGTTSSQPNPDHTYKTAGSRTVKLILRSDQGCMDSIAKTVDVHPVPEVDFSLADHCAMDSVTLDPNVKFAGTGSLNYSWDFGDGKNSTMHRPSHRYDTSGTHMVRLIVRSQNNCADTAAHSVEIFPLPVSEFQYTIKPNLEVVFTPRNTGYQDYSWNFGDGSTDTVISPTHQYKQKEVYTVTRTVMSKRGCLNITTKKVDLNNVGIEDGRSKLQAIRIYPSPFKDHTKISFHVNNFSKVELSLLGLNGKKVINVLDARIKSGMHTAVLEGSGLNSGFYILKARIGEQVTYHRILKVK